MQRLAAALLISLFLGAGGAMAGGGDFDDSPQQQMPQSKIVINVPPAETDWVGPVVGAVGVIGAAAIGLYAARRKRKGD